MAKIVMLGGLATFLAKIKEIFQPLFGIVSVGGGVGTVELSPNKLTVVGTLTSALNVTLGATSGAGVQEYALRFTMGATAYGVTFPTSVKFPKDFSTSGYFEKGYTYEVDIIDGRAVVQKWANTISISPEKATATKQTIGSTTYYSLPETEVIVISDEPWTCTTSGDGDISISASSGPAGVSTVTVSMAATAGRFLGGLVVFTMASGGKTNFYITAL